MTNSNDFRIVTRRENPELVNETDLKVGNEWPEFMLHDPVANDFDRLYNELPGFQFVLVENSTDKAVCLGNSIPLRWDGRFEDLPDEGWDWAMTKGLADLDAKVEPNILCAIQIVVFGMNRGRGLSLQAVQGMKANGRNHGLMEMIAPVRPNRKSDHPEMPIDDYVKLFRDDGLPVDPWLRVHARTGAKIVRPCKLAMQIPGTIEEWKSWTGMEFPKSGEYIVPGALTPVRIDLENDHGVYIEPNVWMHHPAE